MNSTPFLHVRSPKFGILPGEEDELVNEGMYGKAFAQYLQKALAAEGYQTPFVSCEDWGWWVTIAGLEFTCGLGVYGSRIADTNDLDLCVSVLAPRGKKWNWRRFRFIDTTAEVDRLHETLRRICHSDKEITFLGESPEFPLD